MERNDLLRTDLGRKLEGVSIGAVPPSNVACIFLVCVLGVVNQQIGIAGQIIARNPIRSGPPTTREAKGGLMVGQINRGATICLYAIADSGTRMTNQGGSDAEWTNVEWRTWHLMTDNLRQVAKVHWKQGRR